MIAQAMGGEAAIEICGKERDPSVIAGEIPGRSVACRLRSGIAYGGRGIRPVMSWITVCFARNRACGGSCSVNQNRNEHQRRCD